VNITTEYEYYLKHTAED